MEKEKFELFFLIISFFGPLPIILVPTAKNMSEKEKTIIVEGILIFLIYFIFALILITLSEIPLIGLAFAIFNNILFVCYLLLVIFTVYKKYEDNNFELPFATIYAKKAVETGLI